MKLKNFLEKVKSTRTKEHQIELVLSVLSIEEILTEVESKVKLLQQLGEVLRCSFVEIAENKVQINNTELTDLDLDNWKDGITLYKLKNPKITNETYLYVMRNTLMNYLKATEEKFIKAYLFELVIKTFLFIDYLGFSINSILELSVKEIDTKKSQQK